MVPDLRRPSIHRASGLGSRRRLRRRDSRSAVRAGGARQLSGGEAAHEGRPAEAEGLSERDGRIGGSGSGVTAAAHKKRKPMARKDTKTAIMDAAQELIQRGGANAMSYQDISEAVGIRKASIHHHFPA